MMFAYFYDMRYDIFKNITNQNLLSYSYLLHAARPHCGYDDIYCNVI